VGPPDPRAGPAEPDIGRFRRLRCLHLTIDGDFGPEGPVLSRLPPSLEELEVDGCRCIRVRCVSKILNMNRLAHPNLLLLFERSVRCRS
jgi:hypothetical protein